MQPGAVLSVGGDEQHTAPSSANFPRHLDSAPIKDGRTVRRVCLTKVSHPGRAGQGIIVDEEQSSNGHVV